MLVYVCASSRGVPGAFIAKSGTAIDHKTYRKKCIEGIVLRFIKEHHSDKNYQFWPDLASSHYAESVMDCYSENGINFVEKYENLANVPEVRPIEDFRAILRGAVYKGGWQAKNIDQLISRIRRCLKNIQTNEQSTIQRLFGSISKRLDKVRRYGLIEL